jgi:multisubunit Na+/H+ antiporter MnhB subunit
MRLSAWFHSQTPVIRLVMVLTVLSVMFLLVGAPGGGKRGAQ